MRGEPFAHRLGVRTPALGGARVPRLGARLRDARRAHRARAVALAELVAQPQVRKQVEHVGVHRQLPLADHAVQQHHRLERHLAVVVVRQQRHERAVALLGRRRPRLARQLRHHHRQQVLAVVEVRRARQQRAERTQRHGRQRRRAAHLGLTQLEVRAVHLHKALLPLAPPRHLLAHLLLLLLLGQRADAVAGHNVYKHGQQREQRKLPDVHMHHHARLALHARRRIRTPLRKHEQAPQPVQAHLGVAHDLRRKVRNLLARHRKRRGDRRRVLGLRLGNHLVRRTQPKPRRVHRGRRRAARGRTLRRLIVVALVVALAEHDAARLGLRVGVGRVELGNRAVFGAHGQPAVRQRLARALACALLALGVLCGLLEVCVFEIARAALVEVFAVVQLGVVQLGVVQLAVVQLGVVLAVTRALHVRRLVAGHARLALAAERIERLALLPLLGLEPRALFSLCAGLADVRQARARQELHRVHVVVVVAADHGLRVVRKRRELCWVVVVVGVGAHALRLRQRLFGRRAFRRLGGVCCAACARAAATRGAATCPAARHRPGIQGAHKKTARPT